MDRDFRNVDNAIAGLHQRVCEVEDKQEQTQNSLGPALTDLAKVVNKLADGQERQEQQQAQQQRMLYELTTAIAGLTRQDSDGNNVHARLQASIEKQGIELRAQINDATQLADRAIKQRNNLIKALVWVSSAFGLLAGFVATVFWPEIMAATKAAAASFNRGIS